jgi:hypothetical protein
VIESMQREAAKAGLTFGKAVSICAERGWQAFRADWNWQQGSITSAGPNRQQSLEERNRIVAENWRPPEETHAGS